MSGFTALCDARHLFFLKSKLLDKNISLLSLSLTEPSHTSWAKTSVCSKPEKHFYLLYYTVELDANDMKAILDGKVEAIDLSESESEAEVEEASEDVVQKGENIIQQGVEANEVEAETEQ